jgi:hypothetical protein
MRPLVWQAQAASAQTLQALGRTGEADRKIEEAQATVLEIAGLFRTDELREAYLRHVGGRLRTNSASKV